MRTETLFLPILVINGFKPIIGREQFLSVECAVPACSRWFYGGYQLSVAVINKDDGIGLTLQVGDVPGVVNSVCIRSEKLRIVEHQQRNNFRSATVQILHIYIMLPKRNVGECAVTLWSSVI